jgi:putative flippase GtrA
MLSRVIIQILDWIYPVFQRLMPRQTFYYAACGGGNTLLSIFIFFITYNFVLKKQLLHLPLVTLSPHIAAMVISFLLTFPLGFYMARHVVFSGSALRGRHQLMRYLLSTAGSVLLNYVNLKVMVDLLHWYPTISQIINTAIVIAFSYTAQKYFAFRKSVAKSSR